MEGELTFGPALPPKPDGVGVKVDPSSGCHVGKRGMFVQKQDQASALAEIGRSGSSCRDSLGLGEELIREGRAIEWNRARHETAPRTTD